MPFCEPWVGFRGVRLVHHWPRQVATQREGSSPRCGGARRQARGLQLVHGTSCPGILGASFLSAQIPRSCTDVLHGKCTNIVLECTSSVSSSIQVALKMVGKSM